MADPRRGDGLRSFSGRGARTPVLLAATLLLLAALWALGRTPAPEAGASARLLQAFEQRESQLEVEVSGRVRSLLADDRRGSRHQRFVLELDSGQTVLVAHNIDLAPRIDGLVAGDTVRLRGEYDWNAQGGVIHWTHRDPRGERAGGWIEHGGRRYD